MTNYRRNLVPGGTYFFTVNLADRSSRLLTDHIEPLRSAFRYAQVQHPFTIEATVVLPDHPMPFGHCRKETQTSPCVGG